MNQTTLLIWFVSTLVLVGFSWLRQKGKTPKISEQIILMNIGLSNGSIIVLIQVIYKALTMVELQEILDWDGSVMLCLGCLAGIIAAIKELAKLLKK